MYKYLAIKVNLKKLYGHVSLKNAYSDEFAHNYTKKLEI